MRSLHTTKGDWCYQIGKLWVRLIAPGGRAHAVRVDDVTGRSLNTILRGRYKGTSDGMATPADVARFINFAEVCPGCHKLKVLIPICVSSEWPHQAMCQECRNDLEAWRPE